MEVGLQEVETFITRLQNTVSQYIVTRPIMELCLVAEQHMGTRVLNWWWYQECLDMEKMWTVDPAAELNESEGGDYGENMEE